MLNNPIPSLHILLIFLWLITRRGCFELPNHRRCFSGKIYGDLGNHDNPHWDKVAGPHFRGKRNHLVISARQSIRLTMGATYSVAFFGSHKEQNKYEINIYVLSKLWFPHSVDITRSQYDTSCSFSPCCKSGIQWVLYTKALFNSACPQPFSSA